MIEVYLYICLIAFVLGLISFACFKDSKIGLLGLIAVISAFAFTFNFAICEIKKAESYKDITVQVQ